MDYSKDIYTLSYNLSFLTNYFLNDHVNKPVILNLSNKPVVTKFINKIVFPDLSFFKSNKEYTEKKLFMEELKQKIIENVNNTELTNSVLKEIIFYKNQEPLFKFTDKENRLTTMYKNDIKYEYFLNDIFNNKNNIYFIELYIKEILSNISSGKYNLIKENFLNLESMLKYQDIEEINKNVYEIQNNDNTAEIIYEIYNIKKKKILYYLLLINLSLKNNIISFNDFYKMLESILNYIENFLLKERNFITDQEINLLSYTLVINKCIINNDKDFLNKKNLQNIKKFFKRPIFNTIYNFNNNSYLKFL